jgi:glycosyltransferase involved in cell wall biosynthesis
MHKEVATITIYPEEGKKHSSAHQLSALAAYSKSLLHALSSKERMRHVVLTNKKNDAPVTFEDGDIRVCEVWDRYRLRFAWQIFCAIKRNPSLRIVHVQHEFSQFGGLLTVPLIPVLLLSLRVGLQKRIVVTLHEVVGRELLTPERAKNFHLPASSAIMLMLFRIYYRTLSLCIDTILVQHEKFRKLLKEEIGIRKKIELLPIGTETNVMLYDTNECRKLYNVGHKEKVLLFFGTLDWRKGLDLLLDAFEKLDDNSYRLFIAGGEPPRIRHKPEYQSWLARLKERMLQNNRITMLGFVDDDDMPRLFAASDLVILPYVVPQMVSAVLNHAASYERLVIGSEAFKGHVDDIILFKATPEGILEKIKWVFDGHEAILMEYIISYKKELSWENSAQKLATYYHEVL